MSVSPVSCCVARTHLLPLSSTSRFMQGLRNRDIFRFCAIPQIMSIGTLAQLYNNGKVFEGGWGVQGCQGLCLQLTKTSVLLSAWRACIEFESIGWYWVCRTPAYQSTGLQVFSQIWHLALTVSPLSAAFVCCWPSLPWSAAPACLSPAACRCGEAASWPDSACVC
jgi:hypothetical protein